MAGVQFSSLIGMEKAILMFMEVHLLTELLIQTSYRLISTYVHEPKIMPELNNSNLSKTRTRNNNNSSFIKKAATVERIWC